MRSPTPAQLAALELRLSQLAHPDWGGNALLQPGGSAAPLPLALAAALSRGLIDRHDLAPLTPQAFTRGWCYAVLGGHEAVLALHRQIAGYCLAHWVRSVVGGAELRGLVARIGPALYDEALRQLQPARRWRPPASPPDNVATFLDAQARALLAGLWLRVAPALAPWALLMAPPHPARADGEATAPLVTDPLLLDEIDALLQIDFAIELEAEPGAHHTNADADIGVSTAA